MRRSGAEVAHERAQEIITGPDGVCAVRTRDVEIECRSAVICTGGLSYPGTGSTGDGYRMAAELGLTLRGVEGRLHRLRRRLRKELGGELDG